MSAASRRAPIPAIATPFSIHAGREVGLAGLGNRKDIRNAVEAAAKASSWGAATAHNRAQVLYYVAENLAARADEFARRLSAMTGVSAAPPSLKSTRRSVAPLSMLLTPTSSTARCTRPARGS